MDHPYIVKLIDFVRDGEEVRILLEHVEQGNLFFYLTKRKRLPLEEIVKFFEQTCLAIQYIHDKDYIHRDIKPENILIDSNGDVKVCDFGWCSHISDVEYRYAQIVDYKNRSGRNL